MKNIGMLVVAGLTLASVAHASPAVGDSATYTGKTIISGQPVAYQRVIELTDYDSVTDRYKAIETTSQQGRETRSEQWIDSTEMLTDAALDYILSHCREEGGRLGNTTVAAGVFQTCSFDSIPNGSYRLGKVPFALIKFENENETIELTSFTRGH